MEENNNNEENVKVTLLGDSGVGKTCIIKKYINGIYNDNTESTPGASYSQRILDIQNRTIRLDIWDTAGQERYLSVGRHLYKDAYIVCLVYDITNAISFKNVKEKWYSELKTYGEKYHIVAIVGAKSDCYANEQVSENEAEEYAKSIGAIFMQTSAKEGTNIDLLFETLVRQYLGPEFSKKVEEIKKDKGEVKKVKKEEVVKENKERKKKKKKKIPC